MINRILMAAALTLAGGAAHAQPASQEEEVQFRYAAAELRSEKGLDALHERVRQFAKAECSSGSHYAVFAEMDCRRKLEAQLLQKIGKARLMQIARLAD